MDVPFIKPFAARTYPKQVTASMGMDMRRYLLNGIFNTPMPRLLKRGECQALVLDQAP